MSNIYDFIAIGAGPANLSLGAQAVERGLQPGKDFIILEKILRSDGTQVCCCQAHDWIPTLLRIWWQWSIQ